MYPVHWSSKVLFRYKKNAVNGELLRVKKIFLNFQLERARIKEKFLKTSFLHKVIENTINIFINVVEEIRYQDGFLMKEIQLQLTYLSQTKMNNTLVR